MAADRTEVPREVVEAALGHQLPDAVEAAYAGTDHFERRRALMDAWAAYTSAMPGEVAAIGESRTNSGSTPSCTEIALAAKLMDDIPAGAKVAIQPLEEGHSRLHQALWI